MATITSAGENQFVFDLITDIKYWVWPEPGSNNNIGPWLGGHQDTGALEPGGSWQWVNNEGYFMDNAGNPNPSGFTNWHSGEPNNGIDQENALSFFGLGGSFNPTPGWNDFPEEGRTFAGQYYVPKGFIVEKATQFNALPDWCGQSVTALTCQGFEPPMDAGAVQVKKNRVLPLKAQLLDDTATPITDTDLSAPPVIQILYQSDIEEDAEDVTSQSLTAGQGTEGNQFEFSGGKWQFNLQTKNYTAQGTYTITMVSGDTLDYTISPRVQQCS